VPLASDVAWWWRHTFVGVERIAFTLVVGAALMAGCSGSDSSSSSGGTSQRATPTTAEVSTSVASPAPIDTSPASAPAGPVCPDVPTAIEGIASLRDVLVLVDERGSVILLEPGTGLVTCVRPYESDVEPAPWVQGDPAGVLRFFSGSVISTRGADAGSWFVPDDPQQRVDSTSGGQFWPTSDSFTLWAYRPPPPEVTLVGIVETGFLNSASVLPGETPIAPDGRGGLVIESETGDSPAREYRTLSIEGDSTPLWSGSDLIAVGADTIVGIICESEDACTLTVVDRTSGDSLDVDVAPAAFASGQDSVEQFVTLSPDEALLATPTLEGDLHAATALQDGPMVVDLMTGSVTELEGGVWPASTHNLTWSTDGSVLYWIDVDGDLRAWSPTDPDVVMQPGAGVLPVLRSVVLDG
jgi:hypothetical protein